VVSAEQSNHAKAYLRKAEEYMESAEDNLELERYTPAAGDSIHAGISAKDAIVTSLVGTTSKSKNHANAVNELGRVLAKRPEGASAERSLRELVSAKAEVEYGAALIGHTKAEALVRRARSLVDLAVSIVRLGR